MGNVKTSSQSPTSQAPQGMVDQVVLLVSRLPTSSNSQLDSSGILRLSQVCALTGEQCPCWVKGLRQQRLWCQQGRRHVTLKSEA